jgi:hypothetical protein
MVCRMSSSNKEELGTFLKSKAGEEIEKITRLKTAIFLLSVRKPIGLDFKNFRIGGPVRS